MIKNLKIFFITLSLGMIILVCFTSLKSDLFHLDPRVAGEPWFMTTLVDFYFNIAVISAWMIYKENNFIRAAVWLVAFIALGSIATCFYVFLQLLGIKQGEGIDAVLLRRK